MKPGDTWVVTQYFSAAPSGTPTGLLYHNGVADGAAVTVAAVSGSTTGFTFTVTIPGTVISPGSYTENVVIELAATATVSAATPPTQTGVVARDVIHLYNPGALAPAAIDVPSFTATAWQLLTQRRLSSAGTTSPVTLDKYKIGGFDSNGNLYYVSTTLGTPIFIWLNPAGPNWVMSTTLLTAGASSFATAANATVLGPYTLQGSATGTPTVTFQGGVMLDSLQFGLNPATNAQAATIIADLVTLLAGVVLAPAGLDQTVVESGINARQALAIILAAEAGQASGMATTTNVFKNPAGTATRITATTDNSGDRISVTLNLPA